MRPAKNQILIGDSEIVQYNSKSQVNKPALVRRTQAILLLQDYQESILNYLFPPPKQPVIQYSELSHDLTAQLTCYNKPEKAWPNPHLVQSVGHVVRLSNNTDSPILVPRNEHVSQIRLMESNMPSDTLSTTNTPNITENTYNRPFSSNINIDESVPTIIRDKFIDLHNQYDNVFDPQIAK